MFSLTVLSDPAYFPFFFQFDLMSHSIIVYAGQLFEHGMAFQLFLYVLKLTLLLDDRFL